MGETRLNMGFNGIFTEKGAIKLLKTGAGCANIGEIVPPQFDAGSSIEGTAGRGFDNTPVGIVDICDHVIARNDIFHQNPPSKRASL